MRRGDPHRALIRALLARYPGLLVLASRTEPWASATFVGTRHRLACAGGVALDGIEEEELSLPGHVVADICAEQREDRTTIQALTIEDA